MLSIKKLVKENLDGVLASAEESYRLRLQSDINAIGGGVMELELTKALSNDKIKVFTNRQMETLEKAGFVFKFPEGETLQEVQEHGKDLGSEYYAADLFAFTQRYGVFRFVDCVSLKSSVGSSDGLTKLVNDADGQATEAINNGEDIYLGKTLFIRLNVKRGEYEVVWFDGWLSDLTGNVMPSEQNKTKIIWNSDDIDIEGKVHASVVVLNPKNPSGKPTSWSRGVQVRTDELKIFGDLLDNREFDNSDIFDETIEEILA